LSQRLREPLSEHGLLVLFDIDGTLFLTSDPLVGRATLDAVEKVYGLSLPANSIGKVDHPGQTAQRITRLVLEVAGLDDAAIDAGLPAWCERVSDRYLALLEETDTSEWKPAPKAAETLDALSSRGQVALLTGNPEPIARARMELIGLARFFPPGQGAFGCDAEDRVDLIRTARERAGDPPVEATWGVGDTPRDIEGAHAAGIRCVGVASGRFDAAALEEAGADAVVEDLSELPRILL
jgi:phosphoglycolate phosphatase